MAMPKKLGSTMASINPVWDMGRTYVMKLKCVCMYWGRETKRGMSRLNFASIVKTQEITMA